MVGISRWHNIMKWTKQYELANKQTYEGATYCCVVLDELKMGFLCVIHMLFRKKKVTLSLKFELEVHSHTHNHRGLMV